MGDLCHGVQCFDTDLNLLWYHDDVACSSHCANIIDINGDDYLDVVVLHQSTSNGGICVVDGSTGQKMTGKWSKYLGLRTHNTPTIYDVDNDGNLELITSRDYEAGPAQVWDLERWSLDALLWSDNEKIYGFDCPPRVANVMGDEKLEIIGIGGFGIKIYDEYYNMIGA
jgi:hypothetical protein